MQLIALTINLTGVTLAATCSFSSLIISAAVLALGLGDTGCSARTQLIALTGVTLAATYSFSLLIISAAVLALGLGGTGSLLLLGAHAAHLPDGHDARRRLQLQPAHHLGRWSRPWLGQHWPPRAARRACSSSP